MPKLPLLKKPILALPMLKPTLPLPELSPMPIWLFPAVAVADIVVAGVRNLKLPMPALANPCSNSAQAELLAPRVPI